MTIYWTEIPPDAKVIERKHWFEVVLANGTSGHTAYWLGGEESEAIGYLKRRARESKRASTPPPTKPKRLTIRRAVAIAIEGLAGHPRTVAESTPTGETADSTDPVRRHVIDYVMEFAKNRGVILKVDDVVAELDRVVSELKSGASLADASEDTHPGEEPPLDE